MTEDPNFPTHTPKLPLSTHWLTSHVYDTKYFNFLTHAGTSSLNIPHSIRSWQLTKVVCKELHVIVVSAEAPEVLHIQPEDHQLNRTVLDTEVHELHTQETMYANWTERY